MSRVCCLVKTLSKLFISRSGTKKITLFTLKKFGILSSIGTNTDITNFAPKSNAISCPVIVTLINQLVMQFEMKQHISNSKDCIQYW